MAHRSPLKGRARTGGLQGACDAPDWQRIGHCGGGLVVDNRDRCKAGGNQPLPPESARMTVARPLTPAGTGRMFGIYISLAFRIERICPDNPD